MHSIEHVLDLGPGELIQLLDGFQSVSRVPDAESVSIVPSYGALQDLKARWGVPLDDGMQRSQIVATYEVTETNATKKIRMVLTAQRNGIDRLVIAFERLHAEDRFELLHGAQHGRSEKYDEDGIAYELLFPRPLARGELAIIEVQYKNPRSGKQANQCNLYVTRHADLVTLNVRFNFDNAPVKVLRTLNHLDAAGAMVTRRREIPLHGVTVQATLADVAVGHVQIAWEDE